MTDTDTPSNTQEISKCPYCGGTQGFYWKFADVQIQFVTWDGNLFECNNDNPIFTRKRRCVDCNHIVEKETDNVRLR